VSSTINRQNYDPCQYGTPSLNIGPGQKLNFERNFIMPCAVKYKRFPYLFRQTGFHTSNRRYLLSEFELCRFKIGAMVKEEKCKST
jgi:hypothetical protein